MIKDVTLDARTLNTRSKIKRAVMVLLKNSSPEDIKVTKITTLAKISRNSFYTHYSSVSDVIDDIFNEVVSIFGGIINKIDIDDFIKNPYPYMKEMFAPIYENSAFSEFIVFSKFSTIFMQHLITSITDDFTKIYLQKRKEYAESMPYLINFAVSGCFHFIYKWYKDGKPVPIEDILSQVSVLILNTAKMLSEVKTKI